MSVYDRLQEIITNGEDAELECRDMLFKIPYYFYPSPLLVISDFIIEKEYPTSVGDIDFVISTKVEDSTSQKYQKTLIIETKSTNSPIFQKHRKLRVRPSQDLIDAENQLLSYYHVVKDDPNFKDKFECTRKEDVISLSIIIGNKKITVSGARNKKEQEDLYTQGLSTRNYFYSNLGLKIIIWDKILDQLKPPYSPK